MLSLRQSFRLVPVAVRSRNASSKVNRLLSGVVLASLVTGANWHFQQKWAEKDIEREEEVIKRVAAEETLEHCTIKLT